MLLDGGTQDILNTRFNYPSPINNKTQTKSWEHLIHVGFIVHVHDMDGREDVGDLLIVDRFKIEARILDKSAIESVVIRYRWEQELD